jgi:hypothetical protein
MDQYKMEIMPHEDKEEVSEHDVGKIVFSH